jgi:cyclic beta-1,2-glucan synthetase
LKRGLGDEIVVAPYATALAVMIDPAASTANLRRLAAIGLEASSASSTRSTTPHRGRRTARDGRAARRRRAAYLAHHEGMTLVALTNALLAIAWSSAFTPSRACRRRSCCCRNACRAAAATIEPRPLDEMRVAAPGASCPCAATGTRTRVPAHAVPLERHLRHVGDQRGRRRQRLARLPVTRWRRDATRDADGQFIYLRDVRSGAVWSATYQPTRREPDEYAARSRRSRHLPRA